MADARPASGTPPAFVSLRRRRLSVGGGQDRQR